MKKATAERIEQAILDSIVDTVPHNYEFGVYVGTTVINFEEYETVIFTNEDPSLDKKESRKVTKKLVKAFLALVENDEAGIYDFSNNQVTLDIGDLKMLFPKSGRLSDSDRTDINKAVDFLIEAENDLYNVQFTNNKVCKIVEKIEDLRGRLQDLV